MVDKAEAVVDGLAGDVVFEKKRWFRKPLIVRLSQQQAGYLLEQAKASYVSGSYAEFDGFWPRRCCGVPQLGIRVLKPPVAPGFEPQFITYHTACSVCGRLG